MAALFAFMLPCMQAAPLAQALRREVPTSRDAAMLSFAPVVREVAPAVVSITSRKVRVGRQPMIQDPLFQFFFRDYNQLRPRREVETSLGSGVVIRAEGVVVTNHHVVEDAEEIEVVLADRRQLKARLLGSDPKTDLAFLQIEGNTERLATVAFGDSDAIDVGDLVLALGNPFGIGQTVTSGIVSAKSRTAPDGERDVSFIQTDAAINPGNSGGALVAMDGRLIGINTAIFTRSGGSIGIGFAIPSNLVRARLAGLDSGRGTIVKPWLGAALKGVDAEIASALGLDRPRGVLVERIHPGSAADRAGLQVGDIVLKADGADVDDAAALGYRLSLRRLGERMSVVYTRRGKERTGEIAVEAAPKDPAAKPTRLDGRHPLAGLSVVDMSPGFNEENGLDPFDRGVVVVDIASGTAATRLGLRPGDVVETVNGTAVASVAQLQAALRKDAARWQIGFRRGEQQLVLQIR